MWQARSASSVVVRLRRTVRISASRGMLYLIVLVLSLLFGFPFFWAITSSLKTTSEWFAFPPVWIPRVLQWANYGRVFTFSRFPFQVWVCNSLIVVVLATIGGVLSSSVVAYGFSRFDFRGKDLLFMITLGTMFLPSQVTLIPRFILFLKMKWLDTLRPLWVPSWFGGGALFIFIMRQFFLSVPTDLDEAAEIDGAGYFAVFWRILMPLAKPALATLAIISFMSHWNSFMAPLVYLSVPQKFTVALGLRLFPSGEMADYGESLHTVKMAAAVLSTLPCMLVFFLGQGYFIRGIVTTGLKG